MRLKTLLFLIPILAFVLSLSTIGFADDSDKALYGGIAGAGAEYSGAGVDRH